jgi:hypothetical protein
MVTKIHKTSDGVYFAEKEDGEVIAEHSSVPDSVIQAAFDEAGTIIFDDSQYVLSLSGSTPLKLKNDSKIVASRTTVLQVPEDYSGVVIELGNAYQGAGVKARGIHWDGCNIREIGTTPSKLWTGFHLKSSDPNGMSQIKIENVEFGYIYNVSNNVGPLNAFLLEVTDTDCWIRDTIFRDIVTYSTVNSYVFKKDAVGGIPSTAIQRLYWQRCTVQANGYTQYGWKGIDGEANQFIDCFGYDFHNADDPHIISQFLPNTKRNQIWGGIMTSGAEYMDWQCPVGQIHVFDSFVYKESTNTVSNNDGKTRSFSWAHGAGTGVTPPLVEVIPLTADAAIGPYYVTADTTNITVTYKHTIPPPATPANTSSLKWYYKARLG